MKVWESICSPDFRAGGVGVSISHVAALSQPRICMAHTEIVVTKENARSMKGSNEHDFAATLANSSCTQPL